MSYFTKCSGGVIMGMFSALLFTACNPKITSQTAPTNRVTIVENDTILTFEVWNKSTPIATQTDKRYHYYIRNTVNSAQGSYIGRPLNGSYMVSTRSNALVTKGSFSEGVRHGTWMKWYTNGNVEEVMNWKKGLRSGEFQTFFIDGKPKTAGAYKNDLLSGKLTSYDAAGNKNVQRYENGMLLKEEVKKEKRDSASAEGGRKQRIREKKEKKKKEKAEKEQKKNTTPPPAEKPVEPVTEKKPADKNASDSKVEEKQPRRRSLLNKGNKQPESQQQN
jgi:antitoxin component YwqK of YwqJK toxin-antitoxin module